MRRVYAPFVVSAVFHYLGPAFAVLLFARVDVLGVAWLRIASAAAVFAAWRLQKEGRTPFLHPVVLAWGAVLALMNACFYEAIDRLALGTVAAIEFLPVVVLAALGARTARNVQALALAVAGVALLSHVSLSGGSLGLAFAFANALLFAAYIVLADRAAKAGLGIDGLAAAMIVALVVITPIGGWAALPAFADPVALAAGIGVGLCSSVVPYVADQVVLRNTDRATYALLISLLPATAVVIGIVGLGQRPSAIEAAGIALVAAGVALRPPGPPGAPKRPGSRARACARAGGG